MRQTTSPAATGAGKVRVRQRRRTAHRAAGPRSADKGMPVRGASNGVPLTPPPPALNTYLRWAAGTPPHVRRPPLHRWLPCCRECRCPPLLRATGAAGSGKHHSKEVERREKHECRSACLQHSPLAMHQRRKLCRGDSAASPAAASCAAAAGVTTARRAWRRQPLGRCADSSAPGRLAADPDAVWGQQVRGADRAKVCGRLSLAADAMAHRLMVAACIDQLISRWREAQLAGGRRPPRGRAEPAARPVCDLNRSGKEYPSVGGSGKSVEALVSLAQRPALRNAGRRQCRQCHERKTACMHSQVE